MSDLDFTMLTRVNRMFNESKNKSMLLLRLEDYKL